MEVYQIMRGIESLDCQNLFLTIEESKNRGHSFKVSGGRFKSDPWYKFCIFEQMAHSAYIYENYNLITVSSLRRAEL